MSEGGVISVGIDLVDVARIARMRKSYGDSFLQRTFCDFEIDYCNKYADSDLHFAARFAAKEAVVKALKTGFTGDINLKSVAVRNSALGVPEAVLDEFAKARLLEMGGSCVELSLTHLRDYAQAIALVLK